MSFSQIEKEELATMIEAVVKPLAVEVKRQGVLFDEAEKRADMALEMLALNLGSDARSRKNAEQIRAMQSTLRVHKATLAAHEELIQEHVKNGRG